MRAEGLSGFYVPKWDVKRGRTTQAFFRCCAQEKYSWQQSVVELCFLVIVIVTWCFLGQFASKLFFSSKHYQDDGKGGLGLRGVAFMAVLAVLTVLAVLETTLPSCCLSYKIQHNEATVAVLTVLAVSAVVAVSVVTATPLKPNPPFPSS